MDFHLPPECPLSRDLPASVYAESCAQESLHACFFQVIVGWLEELAQPSNQRGYFLSNASALNEDAHKQVGLTFNQCVPVRALFKILL